jgi:hypothetical protein
MYEESLTNVGTIKVCDHNKDGNLGEQEFVKLGQGPLLDDRIHKDGNIDIRILDIRNL